MRTRRSPRFSGRAEVGNAFRSSDACIKVSAQPALGCAGSYRKETSVKGRGGGLQAAVLRAKWLKSGRLRPETEPTSEPTSATPAAPAGTILLTNERCRDRYRCRSSKATRPIRRPRSEETKRLWHATADHPGRRHLLGDRNRLVEGERPCSTHATCSSCAVGARSLACPSSCEARSAMRSRLAAGSAMPVQDRKVLPGRDSATDGFRLRSNLGPATST